MFTFTLVIRLVLFKRVAENYFESVWPLGKSYFMYYTTDLACFIVWFRGNVFVTRLSEITRGKNVERNMSSSDTDDGGDSAALLLNVLTFLAKVDISRLKNIPV